MDTSVFSLLRLLADGEKHPAAALARALGRRRDGLDALLRSAEALGATVVRVPGGGLRLAAPLDLLDPARLAAQFAAMSPPLALEVLDECASTNSELLQRAAAGAAHGSVLACEHQSAGRGRHGRRWQTAVGASLAFSLLWRFSRTAEALAGLSLAVAVGAAQALEALGVRDVELKWPNDLYLRGRKLGGLLIELAGWPRGVAAVVGVGVNVRAPAALRARVERPLADLETAGGPVPTRGELLAALCGSIAAALERFEREGFAPFRAEWLRRHAWQGRRVRLLLDHERIAEGELLGIAEDGALLLASTRGIERFTSGECSLVAV